MNGVTSYEANNGRVTWRIRYRVPIAPPSRKTRLVTETLRNCPNRKHAEGVLSSRNAAIFNGTYRGAIAAIKFADEAQAFLLSTKPVDAKNVKDGELASWDDYESAFRLHVLPEIGNMHLSEITPALLEDVRRRWRAKGAAEATIRNRMRYAQSVFAFARKQSHGDFDPVSSLSFAKIDNARKRAPTDAECAAIAGYILKEPELSFFRPVMVTFYCTALRHESVLSLRWDNLDFEKREGLAKQKGGQWVTFYLPPLLIAELERWRPWSMALSKSGWVFPSSSSLNEGGHITQTATNKRWGKMCAELKISDLIRHDFRRRMTTALLRAGGDKAGIQLVTGHASERMIDEHYDARTRAEIAPLIERATKAGLIGMATVRDESAEGSRDERGGNGTNSQDT